MNDTTSATSLAPEIDSHKDKLAEHLNALVQIRAYVNGVLNAILKPVTEPPPDWFATLNSNLKLTQTHCDKWKGIEASMVATVPQALIDYGTQFTSSADAIIKIIDGLAPGTAPSAGDVASITDLLGELQVQLASNKDSIAALQSNFNNFQTNAGIDFKSLSDGADSISSAISADETAETKLYGEILDLQTEIAKDTVAVDATAIAGGVGLLAGVSMMALGAATMGVGFFLGVFVLVGSIASLATMGYYLKKLHDANQSLTEKQGEYDAEVLQVTALKALRDQITTLDGLNAAMKNSLDAVNDWWVTVETKLAAVIKDVNTAKTDEDKSRWVSLGVEMKTAKTAWGQLVAFATNMQNMAAGISDQVVTGDKKAA